VDLGDRLETAPVQDQVPVVLRGILLGDGYQDALRIQEP
jgi:hypothetical protein